MDVGLLASGNGTTASAGRLVDPAASIHWGMVGGGAGVADAVLAVVGIAAAVAIARWQDWQSMRRERQTASAETSAPRTAFNQPEQRVGQQINVVGDVASNRFASKHNP